ncbi:MAG: Rieske 2Fe-2S domain-containing protein [Acidimicrobiia bacterium]
MTVTERQWRPLQVPHAIEYPDRIPKERYYSQEFYDMEVELLWPRVWQMACRLEEIPEVGDYAEYENLGHSVIVVRVADDDIRAFHNACRHRGVKLVEGHGSTTSGFTCSFHGWCYGIDGANTFVAAREAFAEHNLDIADLGLTPVRCELWGACAWINLDDDAPPLRQCIEPFATIHDAWMVESLRTEWWYSCRLPVNWKVAEEAFMEGYHTTETHPQLLAPAIIAAMTGNAGLAEMVDGNIEYMRRLGDGMGGMIHANDTRIAEGLRDTALPSDAMLAMATWRSTLNDAIVQWYRAAGCDIADLNELDAMGINAPIGYCFPHYFLLPQYSSASSYRFRPLGPEETLMEIWSLTRFPSGREPGRPTPPEPWAPDDPRWPEIPGQDFSNLPKQQKGLHTKGFEYMRLSDQIEGQIGNFERVVDGYLAGLPYEKLLPAMQTININPLDAPVVELDL